MAQISIDEYKALKLYSEVAESRNDVNSMLDGISTTSFMSHSPTDKYFSDVYYLKFTHIIRLLGQLISRDAKELQQLVDAFVGLDQKFAGASSNPFTKASLVLAEASLLAEGKAKYESTLGGGNGGFGGGGDAGAGSR